MRDRIEEYFYEHPSRIVVLGKAIFHVSTGALLAGLIGKFVTTALSSIQQLGGLSAPQNLAEFVPGIPMWLIPETLPGCLLYVFLGSVGALITWEGQKYERLLRNI
jgi:uncharacterized membrane protein YeaQ/YmgE (transglycosylase-associated protein family)